jgi:hypothetical protein
MKKLAATFFLVCGIAAATAQEQRQPGEPEQQAQPAQVSPEQAQQLQQAQQAAQQQQVQQPQPAPPPQPQHIVLRVVGSQVRNPAGERLGLIEEVLVSRANGAIEYAIVSPQYPTNRARQVPVPWRALSHVWDQGQAGGPAGANQLFILNIDAARLATAPVLDRSRPATMDQTLGNAGSFFGQGQPVGATGTGAGAVTGGTATPVIDQGTATTAPGGNVGIGVPVDNPVIVPGQRSTVQPGGDNRVPPPEERVLHPQSPNAPAQGSGSDAGTRASGSGGNTSGSGGSGSAGGAAGGGSSGK